MNFTQRIINDEQESREPILRIWREQKKYREEQSFATDQGDSQDISESLDSSSVN